MTNILRKISKCLAFAVMTLLVVFGSVNLGAQTSEETAVLGAVQTFFNSIAEKSTEKASSVLNQEGFMFEAKNGDSMTVAITAFQDFIKKLPTFTGKMLEQMKDPKVMIHGNIAVVWTAFTFHRNGEFSHSGLDAFQLIKTADGWKIFSIMYTADPK